VAQDYAEAAKWYQLATDQGSTSAQYALGLLYRDGKGVPQDNAEAHMLFSLAAAQGGPFAQGRRDRRG
jgi:TPR repeat protein